MNALIERNVHQHVTKHQNNKIIFEEILSLQNYLEENQFLNEDGGLDFSHANDQIFFSWYFNFFIKDDLSKNTKKAYKRDLSHLLDYLHQTKTTLKKITYPIVIGYDTYLKEIGFAPATRVRMLRLFQSILKEGYRRNFIKTDFSFEIKKPKKKNIMPERSLTKDEAQRLVYAFYNTKRASATLRNRLIGGLLIKTGLRVSELCNLKWRNVYQAMNGDLRIRVLGKGNKERTIPLDPKLIPLLYQYRIQNNLPIDINPNDDTPLIMTIHKTKLTRLRVYQLVRQAAKRAGINKKVSPHWLRHSFATLSLYNGSSIADVKQILGHSNIGTTNTYIEFVETETKNSAVSKVDIDI
ncbi:MAG: tyrosine-type recombinase/integrase [Tepidibacillus sp.]